METARSLSALETSLQSEHSVRIEDVAAEVRERVGRPVQRAAEPGGLARGISS